MGLQELTINTGSQKIANPVNATTKQAIGLNGTIDGAVTVSQAKSVDLAGTFGATVNVAATTTVTFTSETILEATPNTFVATNIIADGKIIANNASNRVEMNGIVAFNKGFNISTLKLVGAEATMAAGQNVDGNKVISSKSFTLNGKHSSGMLSIMDGCVAVANGEIGNVTVENGGQLTVNGAVTATKTILTNGGKVTIGNATTTVPALYVTGDATIDLKAGAITQITVADTKKATITTAGASTIGKIEGEGEFEITAAWDDNTVAATLNEDATDHIVRIYTPAQFLALAEVASTTITEVQLYADITAPANTAWEGSNLFTKSAMKAFREGA